MYFFYIYMCLYKQLNLLHIISFYIYYINDTWISDSCEMIKVTRMTLQARSNSLILGETMRGVKFFLFVMG